MQPRGEQITQLLQSWNQGDQAAIEKLVPLVYDELHRLAQRYMGKGEITADSIRPHGPRPVRMCRVGLAPRR